MMGKKGSLSIQSPRRPSLRKKKRKRTDPTPRIARAHACARGRTSLSLSLCSLKRRPRRPSAGSSRSWRNPTPYCTAGRPTGFSASVGCSPGGRRGRSSPRQWTGPGAPRRRSGWPGCGSERRRKMRRKSRVPPSQFRPPSLSSLPHPGRSPPHAHAPGTQCWARTGCCGRWRTCRCRWPRTTCSRRRQRAARSGISWGTGTATTATATANNSSRRRSGGGMVAQQQTSSQASR